MDREAEAGVPGREGRLTTYVSVEDSGAGWLSAAVGASGLKESEMSLLQSVADDDSESS